MEIKFLLRSLQDIEALLQILLSLRQQFFLLFLVLIIFLLQDKQKLVSAGADGEIIEWEIQTNRINCIDGYFLKDGDTCQKCNYTCKTCSSQDECLTCDSNLNRISTPLNKQCPCISGYSDNGFQNQCQKCDDSCSECSQPADYTKCTSCSSNRELITNSPMNESVCQCVKAYYQDSNKQCQKCHRSCEECDSEFNCTKCPSDVTLLRQSNPTSQIIGQSLCNCMNGYFDNSTVQCQKCDQTCKTCDKLGQCLTCIDGRFLNLSTKKCICPQGTIENQQNQCILCQIDNSIEGNREIVINSQGIQVCSCKEGFYENFSTKKCLKCHYSCQSCTGQDQCNQCPINLLLNRISTPSTLNQLCDCKEGYYDDNTLNPYCQKCNSTCLNCSSKNICLTCNQNRQLNPSTNQCVCKNEFFESQPSNPSYNSCLRCHQSCQTCTNSTKNDCITCKGQNRELKNQICVCKLGFESINNNLDCVPLTCHKSCLSCSKSNSNIFCSSCDTSDSINGNRILSQQNNESKCICKNGYYEDILIGLCLKCHYSCQECINSSTCSSCPSDQSLQREFINNQCVCKDGYYDSKMNIAQCQKCQSSCYTCNNNNECLSCTLNASIDSSTKQCKCNNGFYRNNLLIQLECLKCHESCSTCNGSLNDQCITCKGQNTIIQFGKCICQEGFELKDSNSLDCIPLKCDNSCLTCSKSNDPDACVSCRQGDSTTGNRKKVQNMCQCKSGYFLDSQTGNCKKCHFTCQECLGSGQDSCLSCNDVQMRYKRNSTCLCQDGYFQEEDKSICQKCSNDCQTCSAYNKCLTCSRDQILNANNQTCECRSSNYKDIKTGECKKCHLTCKECFGSSRHECDSCFGEHLRILKQTECICEAPQYRDLTIFPYFKSGNGALQCQKISQCSFGCQSCNENNPKICLVCKSTINHLILIESTHSCQCKQGYYKQIKNYEMFDFEDKQEFECKKCPDHCVECSSKNLSDELQCFKCENNYSLEDNVCQQRAPSRVSNETLKMIYNTTETSTKVAIGTSASASLLLSVVSPNGNLVQQFLSLQKLQFLLLINIAYPEFLFQFFKALGGTSIIDSLQKVNIINYLFVKDPKHSEFLQSKFQLEKIPTSIFYNLGGVLTVIGIAWIVFIPAQLIYKKNKLIQSKLEIYSPFAIYFKKIYEKVICAFFIQSHEIFSLVISFSIMVSISATIIHGIKPQNWVSRLLCTILVFFYFCFVITKAFKLVNSTHMQLLIQRRRQQELKARKNCSQQEILQFMRDIKCREVIYRYFVQDLIEIDQYSRNYKFIYKLAEDLLIPLCIVCFQNNFVAQTSLCLIVQLILFLISLIKRPFQQTLNNFQLILDQICWVVIFAFLLLLGLKVNKLIEKGLIEESDQSIIKQIDSISWTIMYTCLVILFFNPIVSLIKVLINIPSILRKLLSVIQNIKNKHKKRNYLLQKENNQSYFQSKATNLGTFKQIPSQKILTLSEVKKKGYFPTRQPSTFQNQQNNIDPSQNSYTNLDKNSMIIPINNLTQNSIFKSFNTKKFLIANKCNDKKQGSNDNLKIDETKFDASKFNSSDSIFND